MKVYRFGEESNVCYNIIIIGDDGEIRVALVGLNKVKEHIAKEEKGISGVIRLKYGNGSSMPYKNSDGKLCDRYTLIFEK